MRGLDTATSVPTGTAPRSLRGLLASAIVLALIWLTPLPLEFGGRVIVSIYALALVGFVATGIPDGLVAMSAALALIVAGGLEADRIQAALGHDLILLLIGSFVISGALTDTGLVVGAVDRMVMRAGSIASLLRVLTLAIAATAFVVPSTSARAALLLPVFAALGAREPDPKIVRALALLFPTAILLSAGASLTGAGAHFVAVDAMARLGGPTLGYSGWLVAAAPFAVLTTLAAGEIVLRVALPRDLRNRKTVAPRLEPMLWTRERKTVAFIAVAVIAGMATSGRHGLSPGLVAVAGAVAVGWPGAAGRDWNKALKSVDWGLILFLAATLALGEALMGSIASGRISTVLAPFATAMPPLALWLLVIGLAMAAHLVMPSRTARALVLTPAAAPLAAAGLDAATVVMVLVLGSGFCQTFTVSAKPVAIFAAASGDALRPSDLVRLSLILAPLLAAALLVFATLVWPRLLAAV